MSTKTDVTNVSVRPDGLVSVVPSVRNHAAILQVCRVRSLGGDPPVGDDISDEYQEEGWERENEEGWEGENEEGWEGENAQYGNVPIYAFYSQLANFYLKRNRVK